MYIPILINVIQCTIQHLLGSWFSLCSCLVSASNGTGAATLGTVAFGGTTLVLRLVVVLACRFGLLLTRASGDEEEMGGAGMEGAVAGGYNNCGVMVGVGMGVEGTTSIIGKGVVEGNVGVCCHHRLDVILDSKSASKSLNALELGWMVASCCNVVLRFACC